MTYRLAILYTISFLNNVTVYRDRDNMKTPFSVVETRSANMSRGRPAVKALFYLSTFLVLLHTIKCDIRVLSFRKSDIAEKWTAVKTARNPPVSNALDDF